MKPLFFVILTTFTTLTFAQSNYRQDMNQAFEAWNEGNQKGVEVFSKVATTYPSEWLPKYYVAFGTTLQSFEESNPIEKENQIDKAKLIIALLEKDYPTNVEVLNLKALNLASEIMLNPMKNGFTLMEEVQSVYAKAKLLNKTNPRTILGQAEFNIGASKFIGGDITNDCKAVEKAVALFNIEKVKEFEPNWGRDRAENLLNKECKK